MTFVHVTHDQDEALALSDRIAVMNAGRVVQLGSAKEIYEQPRNRFVAQFVGGCNLIEGARRDTHRALTAFGDLRVAEELRTEKFTLALRPERVLIGGSGMNELSSTVVDTSYTGAETRLTLRVGASTLKMIAANSAGAMRIVTGETLRISIPPEALLALED